jgi:hypothetical protein
LGHVRTSLKVLHVANVRILIALTLQIWNLRFQAQCTRRDLVHMGTNAPSTFRISKISKSHTSMSSKNLVLNT